MLPKSAVAEALVQIGRPLDRLADQEAFLSQLYRLTDNGDVLMLRLWIDKLWKDRDRVPGYRLEDLEALVGHIKKEVEL